MNTNKWVKFPVFGSGCHRRRHSHSLVELFLSKSGETQISCEGFLAIIWSGVWKFSSWCAFEFWKKWKMLWKCTVLRLLGNRIAQKSIVNARYKFTAGLCYVDQRLAGHRIDRQSGAPRGGSAASQAAPLGAHVRLRIQDFLSMWRPAHFSSNTGKEKKPGTFQTMPSWVTMIWLGFLFVLFFSLWSKNVVSSQNVFPTCPSKDWLMVAMGTGLSKFEN